MTKLLLILAVSAFLIYCVEESLRKTYLANKARDAAQKDEDTSSDDTEKSDTIED